MRNRILVVGDVIVDQYNRGHALGLSAETPTIVAELKESETFVGGAGLVVRHLLRLGSNVDLLTVIGIDDPLERSPSDLIENSNDPLLPDESEMFFDNPVFIDGWKTTRKIRNFVGGYKILQYDVRNNVRLEELGTAMMIDNFDSLFEKAYKVVLCDNRHGVMNQIFAQHIVGRCKTENIPLYVDSQCSQEKSNHHWYRGADVLFMNEKEIDLFIKNRFELDPIVAHAPQEQAPHVKEFMECTKLLLKRGPFGAYEFGERVIKVDGETVETVDTCGAGDAFLAAYVTTDSIEKANHWAALSTTYLGTIVPKEKLNG